MVEAEIESKPSVLPIFFWTPEPPVRSDRRRGPTARNVPGTKTGELLAVVDQTNPPTQASLWLRPRARPGAR